MKTIDPQEDAARKLAEARRYIARMHRLTRDGGPGISYIQMHRLRHACELVAGRELTLSEFLAASKPAAK